MVSVSSLVSRVLQVVVDDGAIRRILPGGSLRWKGRVLIICPSARGVAVSGMNSTLFIPLIWNHAFRVAGVTSSSIHKPRPKVEMARSFPWTVNVGDGSWRKIQRERLPVVAVIPGDEDTGIGSGIEQTFRAWDLRGVREPFRPEETH